MLKVMEFSPNKYPLFPKHPGDPKPLVTSQSPPESYHPNYSALETPEEKVRGNKNWVCFLRGSAF